MLERIISRSSGATTPGTLASVSPRMILLNGRDLPFSFLDARPTRDAHMNGEFARIDLGEQLLTDAAKGQRRRHQ